MPDDFLNQLPFGTDNFADNPDPRCQCLLLLDTSYSMAGDAIAELNNGVAAFKDELAADTLAMKRVEVGIITFGPVKVECQFHTAPNFYPPIFEAAGDTPMGKAVTEGLDMLKRRKDACRTNGIPFYRPWVFLVTDGAPTDEWQRAATMVREGENGKAFAFFAVGVQNANMDILRQLSVREPLKLKGLRFRDLFQWLSNSMKAVSRSSPDTKLLLPPPSGWAEIV